MKKQTSPITFSRQDDQRVVLVGGLPAASLQEVLTTAPELKAPAGLVSYCEAANYLARGQQYRLIHDPDTFRARYERKYRAEDPNAPFQEGVPRLRDFGHCEMEEIRPPRLVGESVVFYVEEDFLGIPYRVTAPGPRKPEGAVTYEPLPMSPLPEAPAPKKDAAAKPPPAKPKASKPPPAKPESKAKPKSKSKK